MKYLKKPLVATALGLFLPLSSCGGGGGGASVAPGIVRGRLVLQSGVPGNPAPSAMEVPGGRSGEPPTPGDVEPNDHIFSAKDLGRVLSEKKVSGRVGGEGDPRDLYRLGPLEASTKGEGGLRLLLSGDVSLRVFRWEKGVSPSIQLFEGDGTGRAVLSFRPGQELLIEIRPKAGPGDVPYTFLLSPVTAGSLHSLAAGNPGLALQDPQVAVEAFRQDLDQKRPGRFLPELVVEVSGQPGERAKQREALRALGLSLVSVGGRVELWRAPTLAGKAGSASQGLARALEVADLCREARRALGAGAKVSPNLQIPLSSLAGACHGTFVASRGEPQGGNGPNDPLYASSQWNMPLAGFPQAWNLTHGSPSLRIAVLDTGVMIRHPDLAPRVSKWSFDFVSDPSSAGDGDGVDPDPSEPPSFETLSLFHGTYVSGIAAASTDNKQGVAGGTWSGKLLGLRIFGKKGSNSFDRIQALRYLLGKTNSSGRILPRSERPQVVNMSFIELFPTQVEVALIKEMACRNILMAAALGNEGQKLTTPHYPASWPEVIGVVAVGPKGNRAPYSNMASFADLAAPGGLEISGPKGVVSTWAATRNGKFQFGYNSFLGTSVATPHVSAALALLRSVYPAITKEKALSFLAQTAVDKGPKGKDIEYGYGLIDVGKAVSLAKSKWSAPVAGLDRAGIDMGTKVSSTTMTLENRGGGVLQLDRIRPIGQHGGGLRLVPTCFVAPAPITIEVDRSKVLPGKFNERFELDTNGGTVAIDISYSKEIPSPSGALLVRILDGDKVLAETKASPDGSFELRGLPLGTFRLEAGVDQNKNGKLGDSQEWYLNVPVQVRKDPPPGLSGLMVPWKR